MPRTPEQYERIREAKKLEILDAAMKVLAENGYSHSSMSKIASEAKISKGLIYNYFESKNELIKEIINSGFGKIDQIFVSRFKQETVKQMTMFLDETLNEMEADITFWRLYFSIMLQPQIKALAEDAMFSYQDQLLTLLTNFYRKQGSKNPEERAYVFGALLDGLGFWIMFRPDKFHKRKVRQIIIDKLIEST